LLHAIHHATLMTVYDGGMRTSGRVPIPSRNTPGSSSSPGIGPDIPAPSPSGCAWQLLELLLESARCSTASLWWKGPRVPQCPKDSLTFRGWYVQISFWTGLTLFWTYPLCTVCQSTHLVEDGLQSFSYFSLQKIDQTLQTCHTIHLSFPLLSTNLVLVDVCAINVPVSHADGGFNGRL